MRIAKSAFIYLAANLINAIIPFLLVPVLSRYLNPAEYGLIAIFQSVTLILSVFVGLNLHGLIGLRFFSLSGKELSELVSSVLFIYAVSFLIFLLVVYFFNQAVYTFTGLSSSIIYASLLVAAAQFLVNLRLVSYQSSDRPFHFAFLQVSQGITNLLLTLIFVVLLLCGAEGRVMAILSSTILFFCISIWLLISERAIAARFRIKHIKEAFSWGGTLAPHTFGVIVVAVADRFLISQRLDESYVGIYFIALQLSLPVLMIGDSYNRAFKPWLFKMLSENRISSPTIASHLTFLIFFLVSFAYGLVVYFSFPFLVGSSYSDSHILVPILVVSNMLQICYYPVGNFLIYHGRNYTLSTLSVIHGISFVIGGWVLLSWVGLIGLAVYSCFLQAFYVMLLWRICATVKGSIKFELKDFVLTLRSTCSYILSSRAKLFSLRANDFISYLENYRKRSNSSD